MVNWIKTINLVNKHGESQVDLIENEIQIQKIACSYDFTPKIIKTWKDNNYYYIEMENIDELSIAEKYGDKLTDIPEKFWEPMRDILRILYECEGIEYIDITGYNFIEKNNKIFLIDFGHAKWTTNSIYPNNWFLRKFIDYSNPIDEFNPDFK